MREVDQPLPDVRLFALEPRTDERGSFTRMFCHRTLEAYGFALGAAQVNLARSTRKGTLRGLHYQVGEAAETKLVTVLDGSICDVVLDLRPESPSHGRHACIRLDAALPMAVLIPRGCAHGYLTTADRTTLLYLTSTPYRPEAERGVRWNDPAFAIAWPGEPQILSARDLAIPDYDDARSLVA